MKFFQPLQCAVYIAIAGLLILALTLYIETLPISFEGTTIIASSTSNLTIYSFLGGLAILIIFVFSFLSYMSYTILNNYALMNEALKASENRFRAIFEKAPVGIALSEPLKGVIIAANSTYLETVGLTKNDMNTSNWLQNTHPDDLEKSLEYNKMLDENKIKGFKQSKKYIHADGSVVWANLNVSSIKIDDKTPANRLVIIENITEQKKTERELINSQRNLEEAQRLAKIGSWEYKIATKETKWSKEFYNVLELDEKSTTNIIAAYKAICNPKDLENIDEQIKIATATGASFSYEHSVTCKSGNIKHLLCIGETLKNAEGKVIGFRGTEQDITEMKKMQALLKTKEQNASLIRYAAQVPGAMYQFRFFPNGKFEFPFVSDGAKELCGYTPEEIMADVLKAFYLVHPDDFELLLQSVQQSMERLEYWQHDFRIVLPETGIKWIRGNAKPERLEDGSILWHGYFNDISESKQAEETLKINKSKLEVVFNGSNSAIMLLTRERFFDCNPQTLEMFGLSNRSEFIECHPSDLSPELQPDGQNSFSKANQMIEIAFEKGVNRFEWIHKRKDGSPFPAEVLLSAFNYGNERVLQAAVTDITERKKAEKKILENEALLTSILQTLPVAVFGKDVQRNFSFSVWNKKAEEIFGVKAEDCIGKTDYDFFSKKDADWFRFNDLKACETYKEVNIPEEIVETANKKAIVRTKKTIVKGVNDEPLIILGVSEDISEQKKAEQELKRSEEKYRSVVESAADIILTADKDFIISFINHNQYGEPSPAVVGKNVLDFVPKEYHQQVKQKAQNIFNGMGSQTFEMQILHSDGFIAWYSINAGPIFFDKEVVGVTVITRNISERKQGEEKVKQSLKEKEILLQEVHHRVKNNLQIILSIINLQFGTVKDKKTLDLLRDVRNRIKAMSFVHELLYQANDFSSINFSEYVSNIINNLIYSYAQKQSVVLKQDIDPVFLDLDIAIPCGLIINELITNSLKYAFSENENGELFISLKQTDGTIKMVIADTGKGFPNTINFRKTKSLGMQLVVALLDQIGGTIELDNTNGTAFSIAFKNK